MNNIDHLFKQEINSIKALNKIPKKFPYTKSVFIYVIIERLLKMLLLEKRNEIKNKDIKSNKNKCIDDYNNVDDNLFIKEFLTEITLWKTEKLLIGDNDPKYNKKRNDLIHSNIYLKEDNKLNSYNERDEKNINCYKKALEDLIEVLIYTKKYYINLKGNKIKIKKI